MYCSPSSRKTSVYRLRSAPASRASSIPRHFEGDDELTSSNKQRNFMVIPRLSLSRPRTLERDKPSRHSKTITPHSRSKSQSRGDVTGDEVTWKRRSESCSIPYRRDSLTSSPSRVSFQDYKGLSPPCVAKENVQARSADNKNLIWPRSVSRMSRSMMHPDYSYSQYQPFDSLEDEAADTRSVETLEADLKDLMNQIAQQYQRSFSSPSPPRSESPPPYEQVSLQKARTKQVLSLQKSAPGSLSGSRRASQDLSVFEEPKKGLKSQKNQF